MPDRRPWRPGMSNHPGASMSRRLSSMVACFQSRLIDALLPSSVKGLAELIYLVGHYCFVSTTLNGFAIGVPDDHAAN
jgi:hypothetical protein